MGKKKPKGNSTELSYLSYTDDTAHMEQYSEYQKRYAQKIRESDKVLIEILRSCLGTDARKSLLDLGCSTGNLLLHLKRALPNLEFHGADIVSSIIEENKANPMLVGIEFTKQDMLNLTNDRQYDVVVTNASLMFFDDQEFERVIRNIGSLLTSGSLYIAFDLFHPFEQEVMIVERSKLHPCGLKFYFRSYSTVRAAIAKAGFVAPDFRFFSMPIDIPRPTDLSDITSYTVQTDREERLSFRGTLYQPWCHLVAHKG